MKQFKHLISQALLLAFCAVFASPVQAETQSQKTQTEKVALEFSHSYATRSLAKLDDSFAYLSPIELVYEHSLGQAKPERKSFKNLAEMEQWLQSKQIQGLPGRKTEPLRHCQKGLCQYAIQGLFHNQLYLKGFSYLYLNGKPVLKTVYLLDGD